MASSGDIRAILSPARFNTLPSDTQSVLVQAWNTQTGQLKAELEKTKVNGEQKISELQKKNQDLESKLAAFTEESEKGQSALSQYREQATAAGATAARLTEENGKLAAERDDLRRQIFNAKAEKDDIAGLSERRLEEIERLHSKIRELTEEVNRAVSAKCEAVSRLEDLDSKESNLQFKERRFIEEKNFLESQIEMLKAEVEVRNEEVLTSKQEAGIRQIELNQEIEEKTQEIKSLARREESAVSDAESYRKRAEKLAERLREARESESKLEDNYRAELKSQTKLAELYRQQGEENSAKTEELSSAVSSLQQMVRDAGEKYGILEIQMETMKTEHKMELQGKVETIMALKKELEDANRLIKTVKDKGLTEDAIEHLSPSAAQASRLLKSGVTLTGIYSQMVSLSEELTAEKEENKRLNSYMDQILIEIEERAPILRQQREDYEQAISALGGLTENLEAAREEVELRRREAEEARRNLSSVEKDRDRLEQQVSDLGRQISVLVREVDAARAGVQSIEPIQSMDTTTSESVIEGRLLLFRDISELQTRNIELLAVVRDLSSNRDQAESALVQEKTAEVRCELESALRQVDELKSARERQQLMVENIIQQRDLYKSMCGAEKKNIVKKPESAPEEPNQKTILLEKQLEELRKDFAEYKEEKIENYNILNKEYKKAKEDLFEARTQVAKLSSHEEYNNERFKIAQTNCASFKKQIEALEMRNMQLDKICGKHENSITSLREELLISGRKLSHLELQVNHLTQENSHLKAVEARLSAERDVLYREKSSSSQIMSNLQMIQVNLERRDDENRMRLENSNLQLTKEVELLRKKLDDDQDHFKQSVRTWESTNRELREKAEASEKSEKNVLEQLNALTVTLDTMKEELREKQDELQLAESRLAGRGQLSSQSSVGEGEGKNRYRDVEILLGKSKQEIKQLNNQLAAEKKKVEEFKLISETAEKRMLESSEAMQELKSSAENKIKQLEEEKITSDKTIEENKSSMKELMKKIEDLEAEVGTSGGELRDKLKYTTIELEDARKSIEELKKQDLEIRERITVLAEESKDAQEKYQHELLLHAKDIEQLNQMKAETSNRISNMEEIELEKRKAEAKISELEEAYKKDGENLNQEVSALRAQVEVLREENKALMNQIEAVSGQLADVSASGHNLDASNLDNSALANTSIRSMNEDDASTDQLMTIIKYLRREKEIVYGRMEVAQSELSRTTRQLEHAQKLVQDLQNALDSERQGTNENLMTAGKHAELLRKVESLAALTDSNKMLREEKDRLATVVENFRIEAEQAKEKIAPLNVKIKDLEDKYGTLLTEKLALQTESEGWKKRSDQLVEKSFKMNPEELKRLQDAETKLTRQLSILTAEKKNGTLQYNNLQKELHAAKISLQTAQKEAKKNKEELDKKTLDLKTLIIRETTQKNQLNNLSRQNNELKKKSEEFKKKSDELEKTNQELEKSKQENTINLTKLTKDLTAAQSKIAEVKSGGEDMNTLKVQITSLTEENKKSSEEMAKLKTQIKSLKAIGRQFRERSEAAGAEVTSLKDEISKVKESCSKLEADVATKSIELQEARSLIESLDADGVAETMETMEKEKITLEQKLKEQEEKTRKLLENAKLKINELKAKNRDLTENDEKALIEKKNQEIEKQNKEIEQARMEKEKLRNALDSSITALRNENLTLKNAVNDMKEEKDKQQEQIEQLQHELLASQSAAAKPVAVAGVVHQQETRKQTQPQAHIQPHRHQPRDEYRPTQTASIRPMTQTRGATQAVVLPTSQVSSIQPEVATVQPTVSVSPSVSSATPQLPSTSALDPTAPEFNPVDRSTSSAEVAEPVEEASRVSGNVRPLDIHASTSGPSGSMHSAQTSTSGNTQTTVSVQPTLKRPREVAEVEFSAVDLDEAGPSGIQKKARTISSTEDQEFIEQEELGESGFQELDVEPEKVDFETITQPETGLGSSSTQDTTAPIDEGADAFSVEQEDMEEGEISEDGDEEAEDTPAQDIDELAEDDTTQTGLEINDGETEPVVPDNQEELSEEEREEEEEDEEEQLVDEDVTGENSSEPSSSTGATVPQSSQFPPAQASQPGVGFDQELVEDSVVPSTPKLAEPRRPEGFAEAVSSPQAPGNERFVFGSGGGANEPPEIVVTSSNTGLVGQEGAERTSFDIAQFAEDKEGETVSETLQATSPAPIADELNELSEGVSGSLEEQGEAQSEGDASGSREVEDGVSSSGAETAGRMGRTRTPITWAGSPAGPASTSPQRSLNRAGIAGATQFRSAIRGVAKRGAKRGGT